MKECPLCKGTGYTETARDLLYRPPREEREYIEHLSRTLYQCGVCQGKGFIGDDRD